MKLKIITVFVVAFTLFSCNKGKNKESLSDSPRHHEWIDLKRSDGTVCKAFVVYPESEKPTQSVIVIHENRGLNDWARGFADKLAKKGYLVIAPDLISNTVPGIEKTTDFKNSDDARKAIYSLNKDMVTADLNAAFEYVKNDKAATGEVSVIGFCWGGSQSFRYATNNSDLKKALVFYGTAPKDSAVYSNIKAPIYGFYGGKDNRVNSTIPDTERYMLAYQKNYEKVIYKGAGHAFMRRGAQISSDKANKDAHDAAWKLLLAKLGD